MRVCVCVCARRRPLPSRYLQDNTPLLNSISFSAAGRRDNVCGFVTASYWLIVREYINYMILYLGRGYYERDVS